MNFASYIRKLTRESGKGKLLESLLKDRECGTHEDSEEVPVEEDWCKQPYCGLLPTYLVENSGVQYSRATRALVLVISSKKIRYYWRSWLNSVKFDFCIEVIKDDGKPGYLNQLCVVENFRSLRMGDLKRPLFLVACIRRPQRRSSRGWLNCHRCTDAFLGKGNENFLPPERYLSIYDETQDVEQPVDGWGN